MVFFRVKIIKKNYSTKTIFFKANRKNNSAHVRDRNFVPSVLLTEFFSPKKPP